MNKNISKAKRKIKKWIVSGITVVVLGTGIGSYFYFTKDDNYTAKAQTTTQTATSEVGDVEVNVSGTGSISAINSEAVSATENATVDEVLVSVGDEVEKGDELVTFDGDIDPITAPFDGEITSLNVEEDGTVSMGTEVLGITNYDSLEMVVNVDELDIAKVKVGQEATVAVSALDDKEFTGKVTSVAKEANTDSSSSVATYEVTVKITKPKGLLVGMTAEATITTSDKTDVVTVPIEALQKEDGKYYVLIPSSTTASEASSNVSTTKQTVEVGLENEDVAEITSGLEEGTTVVLPTFESSSDSTQNQQMPAGGGGEMPSGNGGGQMPSGGQAQGGGSN
ncbi:efflux RND transporter periplasmic adaptor subunit [Niallia nealsonii]|nr:efflux RND transporter periplasmic adaptor subunit [Niallia nealsonii]